MTAMQITYMVSLRPPNFFKSNMIADGLDAQKWNNSVSTYASTWDWSGHSNSLDLLAPHASLIRIRKTMPRHGV